MPIGSTAPPCAAATLPHVVLCTVGELAAGQLLCGDAAHAVTSTSDSSGSTLALTMNRGGRLLVDLETAAPAGPSADPATKAVATSGDGLAASPDATDAATAAKKRAPGPVKRSVALAMHPVAGGGASATALLQEVFAFDRNCYHVGYPLDLGPIEDVPFSGRGMIRGKKSTTESGTVLPKADDTTTGEVAVRRPSPPPSSLRPGRLDCDLPVASSEGKSAAGDAPACGSPGSATAYTCVTCPLHNRIFDLRTGDMIALAAAADDAEVTVATPTTCKQRIHQVIFLRRTAAGAERPLPTLAVFPNQQAVEAAGFTVLCDPWAAGAAPVQADDLVGFIDSFGASNPMRLPHLAGVRHLRNTQLPSDAENKPRAPEVPLL